MISKKIKVKKAAKIAKENFKNPENDPLKIRSLDNSALKLHKSLPLISTQ